MARVDARWLPIVAALTCGASPVLAADYPQPQPQPIIIPQPVVIEEFAAWYLRGDIGFSNQQIKNLTNVQDVNNSVRNVGLGFDGAPIFGLGIGYYYNDWLRLDLTGEYRARSNFHGSQIITAGCCTYTDEYTASKSEWLFLANAYVDLGTWYNLTPFVGLGAGFARVTIHSLTDVNTPLHGVAFGDTQSKWNFAWAVHAGLAYKVSKNFTVELAYRYVDLGNAESGDLYTYLGQNNIFNPMEFKRLTSHDIRLGVRFNLDGFAERSRPIYYTPPPQTYSPPSYSPPVYAPPPPLRSRG